MKKYDTLILNRHWVPVHIVDYKRCMSLIFQGHARSLDNDFVAYEFEDWLEFSILPEVLDNGYMFVNTVSHKIAVPDIIVLKKYDRINVRDTKFSRQNLFERDKFTCMYCGKKFRREHLTVDHVIPRSAGGTNNWNNLVSACGPCNAKKADKTLKEAGLKLIKKPEEPKWISPLHKAASKPNIRPNWKKFLKSYGVE